MTMICRLLGHVAVEPHSHQSGFEFTRCARCDEDLFRHEGSEWRLLVSRDDTSGSRAAERYRSDAGRAPPRHNRRANTDGGYDPRQRGKAAEPKAPRGTGAAGTRRNAGDVAKPGNRSGVSKPIIVSSPPKCEATKARDRARRYRRWWLSRTERGQGEVR